MFNMLMTIDDYCCPDTAENVGHRDYIPNYLIYSLGAFSIDNFLHFIDCGQYYTISFIFGANSHK